jgi:hypothetical protein
MLSLLVTWLPGAVGLESADLAVAEAGDGGDQLAVLVDDPQNGVTELDRDSLAGVREGDLDALAGDLDAAAAGDFPLDGQRGGREWFGSRESYALEPVAS